jgi:hypothetical protein
MSLITLGEGPEAIRLSFESTGVVVRSGAQIITGNLDMAHALRWVLDHQDPDVDEPAALGDTVTVGDICALLGELAQHGVPVNYWGPKWARQCDEVNS